MDLQPPYAGGAERLRLIYRLPLSGSERAFLIIGSDAQTEGVLDPAIQHSTVDVVRPGSALSPSAYDVVLLPGSWAVGSMGDPSRSPSAAPRRTLSDAYAALKPGGILVGHLDHLASAHGLRASIRHPATLLSWFRLGGLISGPGCRRTLAGLGFTEPECFYVEPRIDSPRALVPVHRRAARTHFLRAIPRARADYTWPGFLLRMVLAGVRMGGFLQPHLFFWARRPC